MELKNFRVALGLTQTDMAKIFGITQAGYQAWEIGKNNTPADIENRLENLFSLFMSDIYADRNGQPISNPMWAEVVKFWARRPELGG